MEEKYKTVMFTINYVSQVVLVNKECMTFEFADLKKKKKDKALKA